MNVETIDVPWWTEENNNDNSNSNTNSILTMQQKLQQVAKWEWQEMPRVPLQGYTMNEIANATSQIIYIDKPDKCLNEIRKLLPLECTDETILQV